MLSIIREHYQVARCIALRLTLYTQEYFLISKVIKMIKSIVLFLKYIISQFKNLSLDI